MTDREPPRPFRPGGRQFGPRRPYPSGPPSAPPAREVERPGSTGQDVGSDRGEGRIYGRNPVLELLRTSGRQADEIAVLAGGRGPLAEIVALARRAGVKVSFRTRDQLTAIAGTDRHQGVVARVAAQEYLDLEALLGIPSVHGGVPFFLALDQVQDPRNFGALLRSAAAFGVHGVVIPKHHAVGLTDAVARTAMGAAEHVAVARETNLVNALGVFKESGVWVYGLAAADGVPIWRADLSGPVCLVLGSEGEGLRPLVERTCDVLLTIPMAGGVGSLNVGAAGAVACYEVARQRAERSLAASDAKQPNPLDFDETRQ